MIRKLNRIIQLYMKKTFKSIPNATIYKLVEASEERFKQKPICSTEVSQASQDVISKMLRISAHQDLQPQENPNLDKSKLDQYKELIEEINKANKNYKKKSKKIKNSTIKAPVRTKKTIRAKKDPISFDQDYSADQSQSESENSQNHLLKSYNPKLKFQHDIEPQDQSNEEKSSVVKSKKVQVKQGDEMQELLKNIGLLHEGKNTQKQPDLKSEVGNQSIKSYSDFQNQSEGLSIFQDSSNCWKKESRMFTRMNKRLFGGSGSQIEGL